MLDTSDGKLCDEYVREMYASVYTVATSHIQFRSRPHPPYMGLDEKLFTPCVTATSVLNRIYSMRVDHEWGQSVYLESTIYNIRDDEKRTAVVHVLGGAIGAGGATPFGVQGVCSVLR